MQFDGSTFQGYFDMAGIVWVGTKEEEGTREAATTPPSPSQFQ